MFEIPKKCVRHVVGRNGKIVRDIKTDTDTHIDIQHEKSGPTTDEDPSDVTTTSVSDTIDDVKVQVKIQGEQASINEAKKRIMAIVNETVGFWHIIVAYPLKDMCACVGGSHYNTYDN